ncbi:MAG: LuxR C-terminal-related transcriptional regulator [Pseudomonadota bacterium]
MSSIQAFVPASGMVDVPSDAMAALVRDAGTPGFIDTLLVFCRRSIGADFVSVFSRTGNGGPRLVGTATTTGADNTRRAAEGYMQHYGSDVNFALMTRAESCAYLTYQTAADITAPGYRRACYDRTGIADRLSYVRTDRHDALSISVYRSRRNGRFSEGACDRTSALMPILIAAVDRHAAADRDHGEGTIELFEQELARRHPRLTVREREVAARVKAGLSARQIGLDLGIAETTVISHRKNAYARMGVSSLRGLLQH